eukprot:TRINITY_DN31316_c0_g1_i1.p1 TRINITY_DN31316_c0_g1~~TRINITY_DN31316_c0_g1_i1.p1  ORF type:complete len:229 (+),score=6.15 TRINITY_DN31316_c0_g1_i1:103-789(+)
MTNSWARYAHSSTVGDSICSLPMLWLLSALNYAGTRPAVATAVALVYTGVVFLGLALILWIGGKMVTHDLFQPCAMVVMMLFLVIIGIEELVFYVQIAMVGLQPPNIETCLKSWGKPEITLFTIVVWSPLRGGCWNEWNVFWLIVGAIGVVCAILGVSSLIYHCWELWVAIKEVLPHVTSNQVSATTTTTAANNTAAVSNLQVGPKQPDNDVNDPAAVHPAPPDDSVV